MAEITNAEAVKFCNEKIRVAADRLARAYYFAKQVKDEWYANNMGTLFPEGDGPVVDGSATDGRHPLMRDDVVLLINRCEDLITDYEANSNAKLNTVLNVSVNPQG
jgi:hypothetical protein